MREKIPEGNNYIKELFSLINTNENVISKCEKLFSPTNANLENDNMLLI